MSHTITVLAAGDPVENLKSWAVALLLGLLFLAVILGLVRSAFKFTPIAIIGAILLGALVLASPFLIQKIGQTVSDHADTPTAPPAADFTNPFTGGGTPTSAGG